MFAPIPFNFGRRNEIERSGTGRAQLPGTHLNTQGIRTQVEPFGGLSERQHYIIFHLHTHLLIEAFTSLYYTVLAVIINVWAIADNRRENPVAKKRGHNEGTISQRADGRWQGRVTTGYTDGKQVRKYIYGKTRQEVAEGMTRILGAMQHGIKPGDDRQSVAAFLASWIEAKDSTVRPNTLKSYRDTVRLHITPEIGRIALTRLSPQDVRAMMTARAKAGVAPPSVRYAVRVLRIALADAMRMERVPRNVATLVKPPKVAKKHITMLTPTQAAALLTAAADDRMEAVYAVAVSTGLRQGEVLGLTWEDIDLDASKVTVRYQLQREGGVLARVPLKTEKSRRTLALPGVTVAALKRQRTRQREARLLAGSRWQETGYVFTSTIGTPLDSRNVVRRFHAALSRAELPQTNFHSLRHSAASILIAMGASLEDVKQSLGHSQISVTSDFYSHLLDEGRKETAARMDRAFQAM